MADTVARDGSSILTDLEVLLALRSGEVKVSPIISADQLGPTLDLRLGNEFLIKKMDRLPYYDIVRFARAAKVDPDMVRRFYQTVKIADPTVPFILHPGDFALGSTLEFIELPGNIGAQLEGRSGWAREGLNVHSTAGLIHPGHKGIIVFELQNLGTHPLPLYPGTRVAQLLFYKLGRSSRRSYSASPDAKPTMYFGMTETTFGMPWRDWEFARIAEAIERRQGPE
jgi:dCTP deaminase